MKRNRIKISRQEAVYRVALAGISAAVALLMVWLGVVVRFSTIAFFIAASVALMVPLSQKYYLSSVLAYVVSAGLSFAVAGDVFSVMGYVVYFGPMAIISGIMLNHSDKINRWVQLIVKIVYINGALALLYFVPQHRARFLNRRQSAVLDDCAVRNHNTRCARLRIAVYLQAHCDFGWQSLA